MPTGGTHVFFISSTISSSALSLSLPSLTTSRINVISPVSVKLSFSTFVSNCFMSKGDIKLWDNAFGSFPYLLCHNVLVGDWFFWAYGRARPSSSGFSSISASSSPSPNYVSPSLCQPTSPSVPVLSCKNRFLVLMKDSLCDDPINLGFDDIPVVLRCKRHCISAAGISPIIPEWRKPDLPYEPCTEKFDLESH